ncbi:MAG: type II toxin-antitoxin system RelE/ParE family toxin [Bacteroidetes bacterium]|nr:type II toxin-antitoxin system RelE/ParE family toxin [Bacteroidota bacterium]
MKQKKSIKVKKKAKPSTTSLKKFKIYVTSNFVSEALALIKKYPNIKSDFEELKKKLKDDPITGNSSLGSECYKVRMAITDKVNGKSGGARLIIQVKIIDKKVYLLSVYDKSKKETINEKELEKLLKLKLTEHPQKN